MATQDNKEKDQEKPEKKNQDPAKIAEHDVIDPENETDNQPEEEKVVPDEYQSDGMHPQRSASHLNNAHSTQSQQATGGEPLKEEKEEEADDSEDKTAESEEKSAESEDETPDETEEKTGQSDESTQESDEKDPVDRPIKDENGELK